MHKGLFAFLLATALTLPHSTAATERDRSGLLGTAPPPAPDKLILPPIPYLDSMPWLAASMSVHAPQVEAWLRKEPIARPFGVEPLVTAQINLRAGTEGSAPGY